MQPRLTPLCSSNEADVSPVILMAACCVWYNASIKCIKSAVNSMSLIMVHSL